MHVFTTGEEYPCEDLLLGQGVNDLSPSMYPDEFEMVVKTLAQAKPTRYLEIGSGRCMFFVECIEPWNLLLLKAI